MKNRRPKKLGKKGNVTHWMLVTVILFAFVIVSFIGHKVFTEINDSIGDDLGSSSAGVLKNGQDVARGFDVLFIFIFVGFILFLIYSVGKLRTEPGFFFIAIILLVIVVILASMLSNAYGEFSSSGDFENQTATFVSMNHVMLNFPAWILVIVSLTSILLYARYRMSG